MQVYDKVIETTRELLKPFPVKELNRNHAKPWNLLKENEFLLQKEVAFELGIRSQPSTCYQAVTSSKELLPEDKIIIWTVSSGDQKEGSMNQDHMNPE